eukprot:2885298-Alexandrium_andersonii.AAC.1
MTLSALLLPQCYLLWLRKQLRLTFPRAKFHSDACRASALSKDVRWDSVVELPPEALRSAIKGVG